MAIPARRAFRATPTSAAGSTRESGEYRVWLCRSRSMKGAARWTLRLKASARGFPASAYAASPRCRDRDRRVEARHPARPSARRRPGNRGPSGSARVFTECLVDPRAFLHALVDFERGAVHREADPCFALPAEEEDGSIGADLELVLLKFREWQDRRPSHPEDLRSHRSGVRRSQEADVRLVFPRQEHSAALDSAELGRFQVHEDDDFPTAKLVFGVILSDAGDDLSSLPPDVHLEDVEVVGVRMILDIRDLSDPEVKAVRGRLFPLGEIDLGEQWLADAQRLAGGHVLEGLVPRLRMDVRVISQRPPQTGGAEVEERGHDDGQGSTDPQGDVEHGPAGHAILLDEFPRRLLVEILVSQARELDRLLHRVLQVNVL